MLKPELLSIYHLIIGYLLITDSIDSKQKLFAILKNNNEEEEECLS